MADDAYRLDLFPEGGSLEDLRCAGTLGERLGKIHARLRETVPAVERIAVALYEGERGLVRTYAASDREATPFVHYEIPLDQAPSLVEAMQAGRPRIVDDLAVFEGGRGEHTRRIRDKGYRSSYTLPMYHGDRFVGFVFFNASATGVFTGDALRTVEPFAHLIASLVVQEVTVAKTLLASARTIIEVVRYRDPETGNHLKRMSRYARLIAHHLATARGYPLSDEYIESLFLFSPLHDVGKIAIPDRVLLKPARLDDEEWVVMRTHAARGREIIETIIQNFGFSCLPSLEMLRNIAGAHHEALDGSGYPAGLAGEAVPLEARIVTVADVFDALTSDRPYKPRWTNREAFDHLRDQAAQGRVDGACVDALAVNEAAVLAIQGQFSDEALFGGGKEPGAPP